MGCILAEFRGPGVHHNFDDSDSGYDVEDNKQGKTFGLGGYRGRIIFLGDGTEVLTDSDDTEMFDNSEEDKDLISQVAKGGSSHEGGSKPTTEEIVSARTGEEKLGESLPEKSVETAANVATEEAKTDGEAKKD